MVTYFHNYIKDKNEEEEDGMWWNQRWISDEASKADPDVDVSENLSFCISI